MAEGLNEEDVKMQKLLAEWDENDDKKDDLYVDSDEEGDEQATDAKKKALLKKKGGAGDDEDDEDDEEEEEEDDDEEEEEEDEEEVTESEEEATDDEEEEEDDEEEEEEEDEEDDDDDAKKGKKTGTGDDSEGADGGARARRGGGGGGGDDDDESGPVVEPNSPDDDIGDTLKKKPKKPKKKVKVKKLTEVDDGDDPEAAEMKKLLAGWGGDDKDDDDDDDDDSDDDDSQASEREVELIDGYLDHIVLAAPDLEEAKKDFERMAGIEPVVAGTIKGLGIKCARVSFNDASYLEIIAPDPDSPGPIGNLIKARKITCLTPFHYAIRSSKAETLKDEVKIFGYIPDHISMFSAKKDGTPKKWELLYLYKHKLGGICPFFINWANSDHPCATLPIVGKLKKITIRAPDDDPVHKLFKHVQVHNINIEIGKPKLSFQFSSPEGTVKFATAKAVGFKFPGFEDAEVDINDMENDNIEFDAPKPVELVPVSNDYEDLEEEY